MKINRDLTQGDIKKQLTGMTFPMIFGILGMTIFNLVDTFFVGLIGTRELAALSFTFPIVMTFSSLTLGISTGVTAVVAKVAGRNEPEKLKSLVFDSMLLSLICVIIFIVIGFVILKPVLGLMKAEQDLIPIIMQYMTIWLPGLVFVVFPMVGNGIIRALGDTKTPGVVMLIASITNAVLDPLLIFGIGPFPELGVPGAALATVFGRFITFTIALYVLMRREKVLVMQKRNMRQMSGNWKEILHIGLPDGLSRIILPIGSGIITGMVASYGVAAVAGYGIATKMENFILIITMALSSVLVPFAGQNIGAGNLGRVRKIFKYSNVFSLILQTSLYLVIFPLAAVLAGLFSDDPAVIGTTALYLRIVAAGLGFKGIILMSSALLNVMRRPYIAAAVNLGQMFAIFVPLAYLGNLLFGLFGIFAALLISLLLSAGAAWGLAIRRLGRLQEKAGGLA
ncbi:MAG: MATE family efflux transporter [Clostridia bacterium]|nr:MATE family efflux transporter [Clostridia bacterium]